MSELKEILISAGDKIGRIPNAWDALTQEQYLVLCGLCKLFSKGELSAGMVKVLYVCHVMGWNPKKIKDSDAFCNLVVLSDRVTFIFNIVYPDDIMETLSLEELDYFTKRSPEHDSSALGRYLSKKEYHFVLDSCFCCQLMPELKVGRKKFSSYTINVGYGSLTTSLVAIQYLDARELTNGEKKNLPLLASILYFSGRYDSNKAHAMASTFANLSEDILEAISLNFISFNNYLFHNTPFSILTAGTGKKESMSIGAVDSLYNLSVDGYGDINTVYQMNLIEYLTICRKKTIDTVRSLNDSQMKLTDIVEKTGLPINIINDIIR